MYVKKQTNPSTNTGMFPPAGPNLWLPNCRGHRQVNTAPPRERLALHSIANWIEYRDTDDPAPVSIFYELLVTLTAGVCASVIYARSLLLLSITGRVVMSTVRLTPRTIAKCSQGCDTVSWCVVGPGAAVVSCDLVACSRTRSETDRGSCFANGLAIAVGPETRGREVACYATMSLAEAAAAAVDRASPEAVKEQRVAVDEYAELARYGNKEGVWVVS